MAYDMETVVDSVEQVEVVKPKFADVKGKREPVSLYMRYLPDNCEDPEEIPVNRLLDKYDGVHPILSEGSIVQTPLGYRLVHDFKDSRLGAISHVADFIALDEEFQVRTQSGIPRTNPTVPIRFEGTMKKTIEGFAGLVEFLYKGMSTWILIEVIYD